MFDKIKKWYQMRLWTEVMVRNAVRKGILTEEEMSKILNDNTGEGVN